MLFSRPISSLNGWLSEGLFLVSGRAKIDDSKTTLHVHVDIVIVLRPALTFLFVRSIMYEQTYASHTRR